MNESKINNGWILCPSKSYPGKFYYFNVVNGDTAWSLNDAEIKFLKNPPIQEVDKPHCYPEPNSPPLDNAPPTTFQRPEFRQNVYNRQTTPYPRVSNNAHDMNLSGYRNKHISSNTIVPRFSNSIDQSNNVSRQSRFPDRPTPVFGQAVFPKSVPPIIQVPMVFGSGQNNPPVVMILLNKSDDQPVGEQTHVQLSDTEPSRDLFVQKTNVPLSQRFANYENPMLNLNQRNKFETIPNNYNTTATNKSVISVYQNDHSSIDSCGFSKMNLNNKMSKTKLVVRQPMFNLAPRRMPEKSNKTLTLTGTTDNLITKVTPNINARQKITFENNLDGESKHLSKSYNIKSKQTEQCIPHTNVFARNPSVSKNIFAPNVSQTNVFAPNKSRVNIFAPCIAPNPSTFRSLKSKSNVMDKESFSTSSFEQYQPISEQPRKHSAILFKHAPNLNRNIKVVSVSSAQNPTRQLPTEYTNIEETKVQSCAETDKQTSTVNQVEEAEYLISEQPRKHSSILFKHAPNINRNTKVVSVSSAQNPTRKLPTEYTNIEETKVQSCAETDKQTATVNQVEEAEYLISTKVYPKELNKNDLRLTLMAKKRKLVDLETAKKHNQGKKIKTTRQENPTLLPKKKVTFNLEPEGHYEMGTNIEECSYDDGENMENTDENVSMESIEKQGAWYVVVDMDVLLEELQYLDEFVKSDPKCKLLIPHVVMSDINDLARGECVSRHHVMHARHLLRRLATPESHVIVQKVHADKYEENMSTIDSIINCCLEVIEENSDVTLITNDENLQYQAKSFNIKCRSVQQIKDDSVNKPEESFDIEKIKISVPNVFEKSLSYREVPTHTFKKKLFDSTSERTINCTAQDESTKEITMKSNYIARSGKPETKNKSEVLYIGRNLQSLNLKGKNPVEYQKNIVSNTSQFKMTTAPQSENFSKPNERVSVYFQNKIPNKEIENRKDTELEIGNKTVSVYFQNEVKNTNNSVASIIKLANDNFKTKYSQSNTSNANTYQKRSLFVIDCDKELPKETQKTGSFCEIDGIEKLQPNQLQKNHSIFDEDFHPNVTQKSTRFKDNFKPNTALKSSAFGIRRNVTQNSSVFKNRNYGNIGVTLEKSVFNKDEPHTVNSCVKSSELENKNSALEFQLNASNLETEKPKGEKIKVLAPVSETEKYRNVDSQTISSIAEIDKDETSEINLYASISEKDYNENKEIESNFSTSEIENNDTQMSYSLFGIEEKYNELELSNKSNNKVLENYLKRFHIKNKLMEERIEEKNEELICSFVQVMEDFLSNVLQESESIRNNMPPPYTMYEALLCIGKVYDSHTRIATTVKTLCALFYDYDSNIRKNFRAADLAKSFGCGLLLVEYLRDVTQNTDAINEAVNMLNTIWKTFEDPNADIEVQPVKAPTFCRSDLQCDDHSHRKNFVRDRSDVLNYLKNHFPAWADFDETLDDTTSKGWNQKSNDSKILRTCGKDLRLLKIHKSKTITVNSTDNKKVSQDGAKTTDRDDIRKNKSQEINNVIHNSNIGYDSNNKNEFTSEIVQLKKITASQREYISPKKLNDSLTGRNLTRVIDNRRTSQHQKDDMYQSISVEIDNNINIDPSKTEPKVIRLFSNLNCNEEQIKTNKTSTNCNRSILYYNYATHGHTFGTDDKTGPKIIKNIQLIEEYENRLRNKSVDIDTLDYSAKSKSDENDIKNEDMSNNSISMCLDNENEYFETIDDDSNAKDKPNHLKPTKGLPLPINERNFNSNLNENSHATYNEIYSMSLDDSVENNKRYAKTDVNTTKGRTKDVNYATNDSPKDNFSSDYMSYQTNKVSNDTYEFFTQHKAYAPTHDVNVVGDKYSNLKGSTCVENDKTYISNDTSYKTKDKPYGINDDLEVANDMAYVIDNKSYVVNDGDNKNNDSGYENESSQVYSFVKSFLFELCHSFKLVHEFIKGTVKEFRVKLAESKKTILHCKANAMHAKLIIISDRLKRIIQRETSDCNSFKVGLVDAGLRTAQYSVAIEKCLRQAQILANTLKIIVTMTTGDKELVAMTTDTNQNDSNVRYFNLFDK